VSTDSTVRPQGLALAPSAAMLLASSMKAARGKACVRSVVPAWNRTSPRAWSSRRDSSTRLRFIRAPVEPPIDTVPDSSTAKARVTVCSELRSSCTSTPSLSLAVSDCRRVKLTSRCALNPVTASAMALSRQRLSVRNCSTETGTWRSMARSVMAWQRSP